MKKLLLETSFSKIYILVMILITLLILGGYFSYAMFTVSKEKSNAISIVTGNLTYKLAVDGEEGNKLVVPANSSKDFVVTLSNPNNRIARFNFYYMGTLEEGVDTGYIEETNYNTPPSEAGINLEASGTSGSINTYLIRVSNITDNEITVTLGVSVGLDYNDLTLPSDGHLFRKITTTGTEADVIEDDIMNRLNYEDSEQTFATGSNPYNYIWYSGKLWRAVSIDPSDNSVKLVTQWTISAISRNLSSSPFDDSHIEMWLNDTSVDGFLYNLRDPENFIKMDSKWNATMTTSTSKPVKTTIVTDPVGLLNIYEYTMSYSSTDAENGYLNDRLEWWTLSPYNSTNVWQLTSATTSNVDASQSLGVRPAINLKGNIEIVEGRGTESDPYRLEGDNDKDLNGTLLNTRYSGEYISFGTGENNLYRIVSHETSGLTKITSYDLLKSNENYVTSSFGTTNAFSSSNAIGSFLNTTYLTPSNGYLTTEQVNMITDNSTWYLGTVGVGPNYRLAKYTDTSMTSYTTRTTARIGLLRYGELMAGQSRGRNETNSYWILTKRNASAIRYVGITSNAYSSSTTSTNNIKPALNLRSNVIITGGEGTKENPFEITLQ